MRVLIPFVALFLLLTLRRAPLRRLALGLLWSTLLRLCALLRLWPALLWWLRAGRLWSALLELLASLLGRLPTLLWQLRLAALLRLLAVGLRLRSALRD